MEDCQEAPRLHFSHVMRNRNVAFLLDLWKFTCFKLNLNRHSNKDPQRNPMFFNEKSP